MNLINFNIYFSLKIVLSVTSQLLPIATARELKEKQKERELNLTLSSETNSGETDNYEDSSSNSLPDSIEGEGPSYSDRKGKLHIIPGGETFGY